MSGQASCPSVEAFKRTADQLDNSEKGEADMKNRNVGYIFSILDELGYS